MRSHVRNVADAAGFGLILAIGGCATYGGIVRPTPELGVLSPEAEKLTDDKIESYLQASARPAFPTVLAIAKLKQLPRYYRTDNNWRLTVDQIHGEEADVWKRLVETHADGNKGPVQQTLFINSLAVTGEPTLENLRGAAAKLHAPLLLAYIQEDNWADGYNSAAMAYWTIVGMFVVPGNTVGHHSVCEGLIVDTRTGAIVATVAGEAKREENVLPGAVSIAQRRTREHSRSEAVTRFQDDFNRILDDLAKSPTTAGAASGGAP